MNISQQPFGVMPNGVAVDLFSLTNDHGVEIQITNFGGIITSLRTADRDGKFDDIVLGFDSLPEYLSSSPFFGCIVGRFANRIAQGKFTLDGQSFALAQNDGVNHLHGGNLGFDKKVWRARTEQAAGSVALHLSVESANGDENYPGNLTADVVYTLTNANELRIEYSARTDQPTIVNLTNHTYFNLTGHGGAPNDILNHRLQLHAESFTPIDDTLIPTGEIRSVTGTPLDFRQPTPIGERIEADDEQLRLGGGYDHNWVLDNLDRQLVLAALVVDPSSGRSLEVYTDQPGIQFYAGNMMPNELTGKGGCVYRRRHGLCLETQTYPDAPNKPDFPSAVLRPGERYATSTIFRFGIDY